MGLDYTISAGELIDINVAVTGKIGMMHDERLLLSAVARQVAGAFGIQLYESPIERAAALAQSVIVNHPFVDGNKRTAMLAIALTVKRNGYEFAPNTQQFMPILVVGIAQNGNSCSVHEIADRIEAMVNDTHYPRNPAQVYNPVDAQVDDQFLRDWDLELDALARFDAGEQSAIYE